MDIDQRCCAFFQLMKKPKVRKLLHFDSCYTIADKYHLASVFFLFKRANFAMQEYNERNFHLALYLSHDINEDIDCFKQCIVDNFLHPLYSCEELDGFMSERLHLFFRVKCNALVEQRRCDRLFCEAPHNIWGRTRPADHAGAIKEINCVRCNHKYSI